MALHTKPHLVGRSARRDSLVADEATHVRRTRATGPELGGPRRGEVYAAPLALLAHVRDGSFLQASGEMAGLMRFARVLNLARCRDRLLYIEAATCPSPPTSTS